MFVVLLLLVQAIDLWTIFTGNRTQENQEISNRLYTAQTIFSEQFNSRRDYLTAFAETAARDYGIKQVFDEDTRSLLVALNNHRKRIDADLAMTVSYEGVITGQIYLEHSPDQQANVRPGSERNQKFRFPTWLDSQQHSDLYVLDNKLYQLSLSPLLVGQKVIGWVGFGFQLDNRLAQHFKEITKLEVDFVLKEQATALNFAETEHEESNSWHLIASSADKPELDFALDIVNEKIPPQYIATHYRFSSQNQEEFAVAMYGLRADIVEVLQKQWWQLLVIALLTLLLSLLSAYWIAASITQPVKRLVEQARTIAQGRYDKKVALDDKSELGQLAHEFNAMQKAVLTREETIKHAANHDTLTDLPNRNLLKAKLEELIAAQQKFALFHLNLSRLKDVNETLGHEVGDSLIIEAAERLTRIDDIALLCHLGSDEFVILSHRVQEEAQTELINAIYKELEDSFDYQGISLQLQMRIGISCFPEHSQNAKELLQMADMALHHTRKINQATQVYNDSLNINSVERLNLINDLKTAIAEEQLALFYQPKVDLKTGKVTHAEALVRWQHPKLGMVPPDNFIYIAEQTGQINALTQCVFIMALKQFNQWKAQDIHLNIAVNISAENLKDPHFFGFVCQSIETYQIPAASITLEVTESVVVDEPQAAIVILQKFKDRGFKLSIDDYGTGYSSLAQLKQLPVHELKIDKSFVQKLKDEEDDQIIVRSTIELAHNMGLSVVAEGIEDEFALAWLSQFGCELAQGYFISRPLPANEFSSWFKEAPRFPVLGVQKGNVVSLHRD